ncbi:MAG TPA: toll/interleukin-1 receptor domain-containing protein [Ktedonobacteraceae bacterium]|jgi:hypothetical protein
MPKQIEIFFSYTHADETWQKKIQVFLSTLRRERLIHTWHDRNILAGNEWATEIKAHLDIAPIILLLVSQDFIDSDYCWSVELKEAMKLHRAGQARVIPIVIRPTDWKSAPFARLQALPKDGKPISTWSNEDEALLDVAKGIRKVVEDLKKKPTATPPGTP